MKRIFIITALLLLGVKSVFAQAAPDIKPYVGSDTDNRVDLYGTGTRDHYWNTSWDTSKQTCSLHLYRISDNTQVWSNTFSNCKSPGAPVFHTRSFMGNSARDFTIVVVGYASSLDYRLIAGDGWTGQLRDFSLFIGDGGAGILRIYANTTVDLQLPGYPGPALVVRTNGAITTTDPDGSYYLRVFYFPSSSNGFVELTKDPSVIKPGKPWTNFPFPGADLPLAVGDFDAIYNNFNPVDCLPNNTDHRCGVADNGTGGGGFMGKLIVGDIDADRVDDLDTTYVSVHQAYPGRPLGKLENLGAPMYHMWYDPESGQWDSTCHYNRHYGLSMLTQTDADPYLEMIDISGTTVNTFTYIQQNIIRNVGLIDTGPNAQGQLVRTLKWNRPMHVTSSLCLPNDRYYKDALHYTSQPLIQDTQAKTKYVHFNRFTQLTQPEKCEGDLWSDLNCFTRVITGMTGYWSWDFIDTNTGTTIKSYPNYYVWDVIPGPDPSKLWVLYSKDATYWNLGFTDITGATPLLRSDLTLGLLDTYTLQLTSTQPINVSARSYLKSFYWQSVNAGFTNGSLGYKIFTVPGTTGQPASFFLVTATGYSLFAYNGTSWYEQAKYDTSGNLLSATGATPVPTSSFGQLLTPTVTQMPSSPTPLPTLASASGDTNGDGKVTIADLQQIITNYGKTGPLPSDVDKNGSVDMYDYSIVVKAYGH